jgi:branched-chain amino acid transport system ATP-binding protein
MTEQHRAPGTGSALELDGVGVSYHSVPACRDITLRVAAGECVAVVGANGAGKSSLVLAAAGLEPLASGRVLLDGRDISRLKPHQRARSGLVLVPENRHLFPEMTVQDTLQLSTRHARAASTSWDLGAVLELFPRLRERSGSMAGNLSGGERQMLAIARGLLLDPSVMMLDEPSAGLAPAVVEEVLVALRTLLDSGLAILLVEQSVYAARMLADRVVVMQDGDVVRRGGKDLLANDEDLRKAYLGGR